MLDFEGLKQPRSSKSKSQEKGEDWDSKFCRCTHGQLTSSVAENEPSLLSCGCISIRPRLLRNLLLVLGSIRLHSPRLDLLALVSISLWIIRTVFRCSNKLARYELLVKSSFLTSKISHRNSDALKYLVAEDGSQRAARTALLNLWISNFAGAIKSTNSTYRRTCFHASWITSDRTRW